MGKTKSLEQQLYILPGKYEGLWSAYYVEIIFYNGNKSEPIKVNNGVRGINCKCEVVVTDDGWVYVD